MGLRGYRSRGVETFGRYELLRRRHARPGGGVRRAGGVRGRQLHDGGLQEGAAPVPGRLPGDPDQRQDRRALARGYTNGNTFPGSLNSNSIGPRDWRVTANSLTVVSNAGLALSGAGDSYVNT